MPELPEVEHVRRSLQPWLKGALVTVVSLRRRDYVIQRPEGGRKRIFAVDLLNGTIIRDVLRHGKNLAVVGENGRALGIHLGMSGQIRLLRAGQRLSPADHVHCEWRLRRPGGEPLRLAFRDPRRFGGIWTFDSFEDLRSSLWAGLGPDALEIDESALRKAFTGSTRAVKAALLDQHVLAGVGNIYADEALFAAQIHPHARAGDLSKHRISRLASAIRTVLSQALASGGSTIRSYADSDGQSGSYASKHKVYGKAGESCPRCGRPLCQIRVAQRTTTFCSHCQRL